MLMAVCKRLKVGTVRVGNQKKKFFLLLTVSISIFLLKMIFASNPATFNYPTGGGVVKRSGVYAKKFSIFDESPLNTSK